MSDVSVFAQTNVGRVRKGNEDNFLVANMTSEHSASLSEVQRFDMGDNSNVFMVADGMGGPAAGEVASLLAVNTVLKEMGSERASNEPEFILMLDGLLQKANDAIFQKAKKNSKMCGMGTTATLAKTLGKKLFIGQVGDSRAYILRENRITQVTKDQSYVDHLVRTKAITEEEAEIHPKKNLILQALGTQPTLSVAVTSVELYRNDYLVLCSDGLTGMVKNEEIKTTIHSSTNVASACNDLIELANKRGGRDNITLIIAHFTNNALSQAAGDKAIDFKVISDFDATLF